MTSKPMKNNGKSKKPSSRVVMKFCRAAIKEDIPAMKAFIGKYGAAAVNVKYKNGWSALMTAVMLNAVGAVQMLLENGADIDTKDKLGNTIFELAGDLPGASDAVEIVRQWPETVKQREFSSEQAIITQTIMGGLTMPIRAPRPPRLIKKAGL